MTRWKFISTSVSDEFWFQHLRTTLIEIFAATFLYNNYKQALDIINSGPTALSIAMRDLGLSDPAVFEEWREEERVYLEGLSKEPLTETLEMEYYQKLINLRASQSVSSFARFLLFASSHFTVQGGSRYCTRGLGTGNTCDYVCRHKGYHCIHRDYPSSRIRKLRERLEDGARPRAEA
jgi:hypothetical protein